MSRPFRVAGLLLVLAGFVYAAMASPGLPDRVPSHWDAAGHVNGTMPKPWGVFLVPLVMTLLWLLFQALPRLSPRGYEMESFGPAWGVITIAVLVFLLFVEVLTLNSARTAASLSPRILLAAIGVLFAVIGGALGKLTRNFFAGIRTPWTLASEEVWNRTHRLAAKVFVAAGLLVAAAAILGLGWWILLSPLFVAPAIPIVYSYVIYRRLFPRVQV